MKRLITLLVLFLLGPSAHAADIKVFSGNSCQPNDGTQSGDFIQGIPVIVNVSAANRIVVCPIVRNNHTQTLVDAQVRVISDGTNVLACALQSHTALGVFLEQDINGTTNNTPTVLLLDVNSSAKGGTFGIFCDLPPGTAVFSYRTNEP